MPSGRDDHAWVLNPFLAKPAFRHGPDGGSPHRSDLPSRAAAAQALVESNLTPVGSGEASRTCCQHRNGTLGQPALALVSKRAPDSCAVNGSQPCRDANVDLESYSRCALNSSLVDHMKTLAHQTWDKVVVGYAAGLRFREDSVIDHNLFEQA